MLVTFTHDGLLNDRVIVNVTHVTEKNGSLFGQIL